MAKDHMIENPPKGLGISERVKWRMDRDPTTIKDAENFKARWGEYPNGYYSRRMKPVQPELPVKKSVEIKKPDRILFSKNEFFKGESVWRFELGYWRCIKAPDDLKFLLKKTVAEAKLDLIRRGFDWKWIS